MNSLQLRPLLASSSRLAARRPAPSKQISQLSTIAGSVQCTCSPLRISSSSTWSSPRSQTSASPSAAAQRSFSSSASASTFSRLPKTPARTSLVARLAAFRRSLTTATAPSPSATAPDPPEVPLTTPDVAKYLFVIAGMVFAIVVVGGMTRLTESGLSITEWNVVSGIMPPMNAADWESEFEKYRATPEWRISNSHITLQEFKRIYFWEWGHRILGRVIGLTFLAPIPYFFLRRRLSPRSSLALLGIGTLIGGQGALGWYMVKSGLDEASVQDLGGVPRVSQYRLAAHLGMAFLVYASCVRLALGVGRDFKLVNGGPEGKGAGLAGWQSVEQTMQGLNSKTVGRMRIAVNLVTALVFVTAISGAFVAGMDAGLIYNEFPLMGGRLIPKTSELIDDHYSRKKDGTDRWRNFFENPTTVQFDHRMLAMTTFTSIVTLFLVARRPNIKAALPPTTYRLIKGTMHMSFLQVALGISTLIYLVPIHLAATHQAGSLVLLSLAIASGASLRRPGVVARELMKRGRRIGQFTRL